MEALGKGLVFALFDVIPCPFSQWLKVCHAFWVAVIVTVSPFSAVEGTAVPPMTLIVIAGSKTAV